MPIRYFSNLYHGYDGFRPFSEEYVSVYDDPRKSAEDSIDEKVPYGYMRAKHYPSMEIPNFKKDSSGESQPINDRANYELFTHQPATTTITHAFVDPSLRHTMPIVGAYMSQRYGELTADSSLTEFSSKLTRGALDRNLPIVPHADNNDAKTTSYDWSLTPRKDVPPRMPNDQIREIHRSEIYEAKGHLRKMLGRKKPLSPQFMAHVEQPKLPGMENF